MPSVWSSIGKVSGQFLSSLATSFGANFYGSGTPASSQAFLSRERPDRQQYTTEKLKSTAANLAFLPFYDAWQNLEETQQMRRAYRRMLSDPNVKAALLGKLLGVMGLELKIHPAGDRPEQKEHAEFIEWNLTKRFHGAVPMLIWSVLSGGCVDGYSVNEKIWTFQDGDRRQRFFLKRVLRDLKQKDVDQDLVPRMDEYRNITGIMGLRYNGGQIWSPDEFIIWQNMPMYGNPTGTSDLRAAYGRYWILDAVTKLRAVVAEKYARPVAYATYPAAHTQSSVENVLKQLRSEQWAAVPEGVKLEVVDLAGRSDEYWSSFRRDCQEDIFLSIQLATLQALTGAPGTVRGSSAIHEAKSNKAEWLLAEQCENILNDHEDGLIRDMLTGNYADVIDLPHGTLTGTDDAELKESLAIDQGLYDMDWPLSRKEMEERYGRTWATDAEDMLKKPAQQQSGAGEGPMGLDHLFPTRSSPPNPEIPTPEAPKTPAEETAHHETNGNGRALALNRLAGFRKAPMFGENGAKAEKTTIRPFVEELPPLPAPDIVQPNQFSCGASQAMTAGKLFGVGPDKISEWEKALGTNVQKSTNPKAIIAYLQSLGLKVEAKSGMSIQDLRDARKRGCYTICPVQDYGSRREKGADFAYGHYLGVLTVTGQGEVICQDSSEDNITRGQGSIQEPGRIAIAPETWMANWHDKDAEGNEYIRFGIMVGPKVTEHAEGAAKEWPELYAPGGTNYIPPFVATNADQQVSVLTAPTKKMFAEDMTPAQIEQGVRELMHGKATAQDLKDMAKALESLSHADLAWLKERLGIKASGTIATQAAKMSRHLKAPSFSSGALQIKHLLTFDEDQTEQLVALLRKMSPADRERVASQYGMDTANFIFKPRDIVDHIVKKAKGE